MLILFSYVLTAQETVNDSVKSYVEKMPEYPGGEPALMKFLSAKLSYPAYAKEKGIEGKVLLSLIVERNGSESKIICIKSPHDLLCEEAKRVAGIMPDWKPGLQNGKPVRVLYTLPVSFKLQ